MENIPEVDTQELYLSICCEDWNTDIYITEKGDIEIMDSSSYCDPDDRLYFGKAEGDFSQEDWGITLNRFNEEKRSFA